MKIDKKIPCTMHVCTKDLLKPKISLQKHMQGEEKRARRESYRRTCIGILSKCDKKTPAPVSCLFKNVTIALSGRRCLYCLSGGNDGTFCIVKGRVLVVKLQVDVRDSANAERCRSIVLVNQKNKRSQSFTHNCLITLPTAAQPKLTCTCSRNSPKANDVGP